MKDVFEQVNMRNIINFIKETVGTYTPYIFLHILIECSDFRDIRNKYFVASTMKDVFEQVSIA